MTRALLGSVLLLLTGVMLRLALAPYFYTGCAVTR